VTQPHGSRDGATYRAVRRSGWLRRFVELYGWRAYALPVLSVLTVLVLVNPTQAGHAGESVHRSGAQQTGGQADLLGQQAAPPIGISLGTDATPCAGNAAARFILVSITDQRVWMCQRTLQVYSTLVTTGAVRVGNGTPVGTWQIQSRETNRYLVGPGYRDFVHYWMPFDGDFGFHDAPWQTMPYGAPGYTDNGSHGCVHLPAAAMAWLYQWAPTGTTVTIRA
jgi:hypothetical protein